MDQRQRCIIELVACVQQLHSELEYGSMDIRFPTDTMAHVILSTQRRYIKPSSEYDTGASRASKTLD